MQQWIVREWLGYLGVRMPSVKVLQAILQNILTARQEANPIIKIFTYPKISNGCNFVTHIDNRHPRT
jgi:predicted secreted Zn-dependent protease